MEQFRQTGSREHRLYKSLDRIFPNSDPPEIDSDKLLKQVFGKAETDNRKLRRSMNRMIGLAEEFLSKSMLEERPHLADLLVLESYADRRLELLHNGLSKRIRTDLEKAPRDVAWHSMDHQLEFDVAQFEERTKGRQVESRTQAISDKLEDEYAVKRLKLACAIFARERLYDQEFDQGLLNPLLDRLKQKPSSSALVQLYYGCVQMMIQENDLNLFHDLRAKLAATRDEVAHHEMVDLHVIAQNHCIRGINAGHGDFVRELFDLYKLGLEQEVIQTDPTHFAPAFKNIISVAIRLKEFEWARWFIDQHAHLLGKNHQDYMRYNLALLHFAKSEFTECRAYIHGENFTDIFIKMNVRILLLKTYFELDQLDLLENALDNFKQFLHRNKQLGYHRKNCVGLIRSIRSLINLKPGDEKALANLGKTIKTEKFLAERNWLLSKLN